MSIARITPSLNGTFEHSRQGFQSADKKLNDAASKIAQGDITSSRMVDIIESTHMYAANASVVRSTDAMIGQLIDVKR